MSFGFCYNCKDGLHDHCFGVPCECRCPVPPKPETTVDGFKAGLEAAAKHEPLEESCEDVLPNAVYRYFVCSCGQWDSRGDKSWLQHIKEIGTK